MSRPPDSLNLIDAHQHVFWHGRDDAGLVADMDACGVSEAWLLSWEIAPWEDNAKYHRLLNPIRFRADGTPQGIVLDDLLIAKSRYPDRFVLGFCPHPLMGNAPARLEAAVRMYNVRVCGEWKFRVLFDDPRCLELYRRAGELHLPVVLHLDVPYLCNDAGEPVYQPDWYGGTVLNLERALQQCPETNFIGHAPGFWREISADASRQPETYPDGLVNAPGELFRLFDTYPNLYADLSAGSGLKALRRDPEHARKFLSRFASRLFFARDYYGDDLRTFLCSLDLPDEIWASIGRDNAARLISRTA